MRHAMTFEQQLGESPANSALTSAILLSKMNRFAEAIEFCQQCNNEIERNLGIDKKPNAILNLKYRG